MILVSNPLGKRASRVEMEALGWSARDFRVLVLDRIAKLRAIHGLDDRGFRSCFW